MIDIRWSTRQSRRHLEVKFAPKYPSDLQRHFYLVIYPFLALSFSVCLNLLDIVCKFAPFKLHGLMILSWV